MDKKYYVEERVSANEGKSECLHVDWNGGENGVVVDVLCTGAVRQFDHSRDIVDVFMLKQGREPDDGEEFFQTSKKPKWNDDRCVEDREQLEQESSAGLPEEEEHHACNVKAHEGMMCRLMKETAHRTRLEEKLENAETLINMLHLEVDIVKVQEAKQQQEEEKRQTRQDALDRDRNRRIVELDKARRTLMQKDETISHLQSVLKEKESLNSKTESALEEKTKKLEEMKGQNSKLKDQVIELQESLQLQKVMCLSLETAMATSSVTKQEVLEPISDVLECELQCPICSELFISAVTLNCSHTFCKSCVDQWKKKEKTCPICRSFIISVTRSLVVNNLLDRLVPKLTQDLGKRRADAVAERKATTGPPQLTIHLPHGMGTQNSWRSIHNNRM